MDVEEKADIVFYVKENVSTEQEVEEEDQDAKKWDEEGWVAIGWAGVDSGDMEAVGTGRGGGEYSFYFLFFFKFLAFLFFIGIFPLKQLTYNYKSIIEQQQSLLSYPKIEMVTQ